MSCLATSRSLNVARTTSSGARTSRTASRIVCKSSNQSSENAFYAARQAALIAGAALVSMVPFNADAVTKITAYEKGQKYQEELLANIKARTGKTDVLPELKSSPKVEAPKEEKKSPKAQSTFKLEAPVSETPKPSLEGQTAPAAPVAAPPSTAAASEAAESDNKGLVAIGGIALVAVAGLAASSNQEGTMEASPAGASASTVPPNVAEARAWIAAWKKKYNKP
eukprot:jgi/Picsp_1/800/NSC_04289-R1_---NA---